MKKMLSLGLVLASVIVSSGCRSCGCSAKVPGIASGGEVPAVAADLGPMTTNQTVVPVAHTEVAPGFAGGQKVEKHLLRTACAT
jgi:hypothetical protein